MTSPAGGYGTYEYTIDGGTNWQGSVSFSGLAPDFYDVRIRDAVHTGCEITLDGAYEITEPTILSATLANTMVTCNGAADGTITISGAAGGYGTYAYSINGGASWQGTGSYTGIAPAAYDVRIRDAVHTGCVITLDASLDITQPNILNATINSTDVTCNGADDGTITLTGASGGYGTFDYTIDGGTNWQSSASFSSLSPGFYDVRIRDGVETACEIILDASFEITEPAVLNATITSTNVTCNGAGDGTITLSSPTGGYGTYEYSINGRYKLAGKHKLYCT